MFERQSEKRGAKSEERGSRCAARRRDIRSSVALGRGISLTEVLIAMGILTLGLLGVASLFPVGGFYMQKAEIADRGSAIAQSVMSDIVARGMLNPRAWYVITPGPQDNAVTSPNYQFKSNPLIDGKYCPPRTTLTSTFTRPFAEALGEGLRLSSDPTIISRQFGNAYVIDPIGVAAMASPSTSHNNNRLVYPFPASANPMHAPPVGAYYQPTQWAAWRAQNFNQLTWPIRRVTFQQPDGWQWNPLLAEHFFRGSDDLATELPARDDRPATQLWDRAAFSGVARPLARQWVGDYSWIVSVVPTTNEARNAMARNPEGFAYDVSVVVFHKRVLPTFSSLPVFNTNEMAQGAVNERLVNARILSSGLNGGELLLHKVTDNITPNPFEDLKVGQWIMLCGPHPNSTTANPQFVMKWYQVLSIDSVGANISGFDPRNDRAVVVRGQQWPWQPAANTTNNNELSNTLCAAICRGAVAVHTKTIRMENPRGGTYGSGMSSLVQPDSNQPDIKPY